MNWFEDDTLWEQLYPFIFDEERIRCTSSEVEALIGLLDLCPGARILDLACGSGRHAIELARRGFRVVGADRTASYLERAQATARGQGLDIEFVQTDMRGFGRPSSFDAVISMLTSFGYFEDPADDLRVLRNIHESLVGGGRVLIDVMGKEGCARIFRERDWQETADGALLLHERKAVNNWDELQIRWIFIRNGQKNEFNFRHRIYSGHELASLLRETGFSDVRLFGSLSGTPYDHTAQRLVAIAHT